MKFMEHELMSSEDGVTFEDVMSFCNVHANLFKGAIADGKRADADQEGHPVYVLKQENFSPTFSYSPYPTYHRKTSVSLKMKILNLT